MEIWSVENKILGLRHIHRTEYFVAISPLPPTKDSTYSISSYGRSLKNQSGNSEGWDKCIGDHAMQAGNMYSISNPGN